MTSAANKKTSHKHNDVAAKAKAAPAVGADDGGRPCDGCGMLHTAFTNEKTSLPYLQATAAAARRLRQLVRPTLPLALAGVRHTWLLLDEHGLRGAWDMHVTIKAPDEFLNETQRAALGGNRSLELTSYGTSKLLGLLSSPFDRTLYMDVDVHVLDGSLPRSLLSDTLRLADVAMPVDPSRDNDVWYRAAGAPPLCGCMIAYRRNAATTSLFRGAMSQMLAVTRPEYCFDRSRYGRPLHKRDCRRLRQGDQEYIYWEWTRAADPALRMLVLPEEYYCPSIRMEGKTNHSGAHASWATSWTEWAKANPRGGGVGSYRCLAVHGRFTLQPGQLFQKPARV